MPVNEGETPPPYRHKSDANIVLPIDPNWFHEFRKETKKGISEIRKDMDTLEQRLNDARLSALRHDEQISQLATDMAETDRDVNTINTRVVYLEKAEGRRVDADTAEEKYEAAKEKSLYSKAREAVILSIAVTMAGGACLFIWFLFVMFVKANYPGVTIAP